MRKLILILIAGIVTFGVFAKGPMTASAPSLADLWGGVDAAALTPQQAPVIKAWQAPEAIPAPLGSAASALEELAAETLAVAPGLEATGLGIAGHAAYFPEAIPEDLGLAGIFDQNGWLTLPASDSLAAARPLAASLDLSTAELQFESGSADHSILASHNVTAMSLSSVPSGTLRATDIFEADERIPEFRPALLAQVAPVHLTLDAADINSLDRALADVLAASERTAENDSDAGHGRIVDLDSLVASSSRSLSVLPEVFTPNGAVRFNDESSAEVPHDITFKSAKLGLAIAPELLSTVADLRNDRIGHAVSGGHTSETAAGLPAFARETGEFLNEFRTAIEEHNRLNDLAESTHGAAGFDAAPAAPASLDLSVFSEAAVRVASGHDDLRHGSVAAARPLERLLAGTHSVSSPSLAQGHSVYIDREPLPINEHVVNDATRLGSFSDPRAVFTPMADLLARTIVEPLNISADAEEARSEPLRAADSPAIHTAPSWVSSLPPAGFGMNITPLAPRPVVVPAPPARRAAVVVTGQTTLNIAPMAARQQPNFCDANFIGEPIRFSQTAELTLEDLLLQIHNRFGINFLMGPNVGSLPINIKAGSIPWNVLLRSQLFVSGIRARCIDDYTVELIENKTVPTLQDTAEVNTRFIKLQYLQPTVGGNVDIAGQSSGRGSNQQGNCGGGGGAGGGGAGGGGGQQACGNFEKLIIEIEKILGIRSMTQSSIGGGGGGGQTGASEQTEEIRSNRSVSVIPGRNILVLRASDDEMALISQIIERADRPPFQVVIKGLIYTANETKLRDIGIQPSIFAQSGDRRSSGGIFGHTLGGGGTLFDFATMIGTVEFAIQATALEENGVISIKSRPFATVLDGETADLTVGRQVPVLIQAQNSIGGTPGTLQILQAANLLFVTPQVIDDEQGNPIAVNLTLQLESNEVDTSVISQGVPSVSVRSIQSRLILNQEQTVILGGFTVDSDSRTVSKTPGLGDIPILGELFKRRVRSSQINRLYFALAVEVVRFPVAPEPVNVPGTDTDPPSVTPEMLKRGERSEPKQVTGPRRTGP